VAAEERARAAAIEAQLTPGVLARYLAARARDRAIDTRVLALAHDGAFDRVVLGQDDAGPVGLHIRDVRALETALHAYDLEGVASIEPGADELGMALVAAALARLARWSPTVDVVYSRPDGGALNDPLEYAPIDTAITRLIGVCGARRRAANGDIELFVRVAGTNAEQEREFVSAIGAALTRGTSVAVADLTFLGGTIAEQRELMSQLLASGYAARIDAFASWNTNANTVGTVLAEAVAAGSGRRLNRYDRIAHEEFLLNRYADDYAFHQFVRPELNRELAARGLPETFLVPSVAAQIEHDNRAALWRYALDLQKKIFPDLRDDGLTISLPWSRTFETELDVQLAPARL
jgi:hypothetical protein